MKHLQFDSTALCAIGLLAPAAQAVDGVSLHIGGRYMGAARVVPSEDFGASSGINSSDVRNSVFKQDVRVYFEGESTLDNGLQVGARVDLRGQTDTTDQIRDVYAYFSGGFGEVRFGDSAEAYAQMCYLVPSASGIFGADSPYFNFSNAGIAGGGTSMSFNKEFNPNNTDDARTYNGYAQVGFAGFTLGVSAELRDNLGDTSADQWVYGAGGTYNWGAWTVGSGWTRGDYENVIGANGVGTAEGGFNADHDIISATASYALGPGIQVDGVVEYSDYHSRNAAGPDYQGIAAGLGTLISF